MGLSTTDPGLEAGDRSWLSSSQGGDDDEVEAAARIWVTPWVVAVMNEMVPFSNFLGDTSCAKLVLLHFLPFLTSFFSALF